MEHRAERSARSFSSSRRGRRAPTLFKSRWKSSASCRQQVSAHVGDTIEWVNADFVAHTATARDGAWDVLIPVKATKSVVLKAEGDGGLLLQVSPEHDGPGFRQETASHLGIRPETVKTRLHRARRLLRQSLEGQLSSTLKGAFPFAGARCARVTAAVLIRLENDRGL